MLEVFPFDITPVFDKKTKATEPYEITIQPGSVALANNKHDVVVGALAIAEAFFSIGLDLFSRPFFGDLDKPWGMDNAQWYLGHISLESDVDEQGVSRAENNVLKIPIASNGATHQVHGYLTFYQPKPLARLVLKIAVQQAKRD